MPNCLCLFCGKPTDCSGEGICTLCESYIDCPDGVCCEKPIREVRPDVFLLRREDGVFYLKWIPSVQ